MNKAMGTRMCISILEGNKRPHFLTQAAKFSSEAGVAVRSQVPILTHWKEYKEQPELFDGFVERLSNKSNNAEPTEVTEDVELKVDEDAEPTEVDAVLAFKVDVVADGQSRLPSAEVVSKALSQASSNNTFLKNAGIAAPSSRSRRRSSSEALLREELDAKK
ncbi:hypothetical protein C2845_PM09G13000 [Panicum miliaceum]|uniref:Uncharacterized protein n=1 Tax=Panicum miliaceum TaxID=4540 RepID=A0A3L6S0R3_PANMI|nr:hypothetical protein C2845_PM09G13000 [Panicum miliaceum]